MVPCQILTGEDSCINYHNQQQEGSIDGAPNVQVVQIESFFLNLFFLNLFINESLGGTYAGYRNDNIGEDVVTLVHLRFVE